MNIFSNYTDVIKKALDSNDLSKAINLNESYGLGQPISRYELAKFNSDKSSLSLTSKDEVDLIAQKMGASPILNQKIGHHPDFLHLKGTTNTENQYILSAFIDIKGSTHLYKRYDEETIYMITNTIQLAAISVCTIFGGFIQRIQGDGVFVYFGRKGLEKNKATEHAITALSFFTYFIKNDLRNIFEDRGIEAIHTTIGLDFGDDNEVLWAMAGIEEISEIATYSLHTSLASKMQAYAKANQIIIGQNVKDRSVTDESFYEVVPEKRYIYTDPKKSFNYTQYQFNWLKYLKSLSQIATSPNGKLTIKPKEPAKLFGIISTHDSLKEVAKVNKPYHNGGVL